MCDAVYAMRAFGKRWDSLVRGSDVRHDRIDRWLGVRGDTEFSSLSLVWWRKETIYRGDFELDVVKF